MASKNSSARVGGIGRVLGLVTANMSSRVSSSNPPFSRPVYPGYDSGRRGIGPHGVRARKNPEISRGAGIRQAGDTRARSSAASKAYCTSIESSLFHAASR